MLRLVPVMEVSFFFCAISFSHRFIIKRHGARKVPPGLSKTADASGVGRFNLKK